MERACLTIASSKKLISYKIKVNKIINEEDQDTGHYSLPEDDDDTKWWSYSLTNGKDGADVAAPRLTAHHILWLDSRWLKRHKQPTKPPLELEDDVLEQCIYIKITDHKEEARVNWKSKWKAKSIKYNKKEIN